MGAAGDMLTAALTELMPDPDGFARELNAAGIPGVEFIKEKTQKCGITGTHMKVVVNGMCEGEDDLHDEHSHHDGHSHEHHHEHAHDHATEHTHEHETEHTHDHEHSHEHSHSHTHSHHGVADIEHVVNDHLNLPENVKKDVLAVFNLIAEAESAVHDKPVSEIHFHEVGTMDAVADITAVCLAINKLSPEQIVASPVCVGSGQVKCAHGILPVPAPATALILKGIPIYSGKIKGELCTPTGAALLKHFASKFTEMPAMSVSAVGYGMGTKDFEAANCVRAMLGESDECAEEVYELSCNVDDMTAEAIGYAIDRLFEAGACDVYTIPIGMKKNRTGLLIRAMCRDENKNDVMRAMFKHTTTIGIRENAFKRYALDRIVKEIETPYGKVAKKVSEGYGVKREKYEYEDIAKIAGKENLSVAEAEALVKKEDMA